MRIRALVLVLSLTVALAACGGGESVDTATTSTTASTTTAPEPVIVPDSDFEDQTADTAARVDAVDNVFEPQFVKVKVGTKVTFRNDGRNEHNVVPAKDKDSFLGAATEDFEPGTQYVVTFAKPGDYPYYCSLHGTATKGMYGTVRVVA